MRTAREVPTPCACRNSMISRMTFWSAQPLTIRSARLGPIPGICCINLLGAQHVVPELLMLLLDIVALSANATDPPRASRSACQPCSAYLGLLAGSARSSPNGGENPVIPGGLTSLGD